MSRDEDRTVLLGEEEERTVLMEETVPEPSGKAEEDREKTVILDAGMAGSYSDREQTIFIDEKTADKMAGDRTENGSSMTSGKWVRTEGAAQSRPDYSAGETRNWTMQSGERCPNCMKELKAGAKFCPKCGFKMGTKPKEIYHLHPGMSLAGRYMIGTVLGFGGFGITYRAWDNKLNVMVAIKEYYPAGIVNRIPGEKEVILYTGKGRKEFTAGLERFLEEARNTAKFSGHPNIVNVFDFFEENGTAYIVMEFLDGISLKDYMKKQGGRLGCNEAVAITCAIMEALKQVHGAGILHRDISPDNIFLCTDGKIKLIDFGAARFSTGEEEKTMSIVLKMGYAPPEQYRSKSRQGPWTDIYALGATLYRVVTGKVPDESVNRVVEDTVAEPKDLEPSIPDYLSRAIMKAMALTPEFRFQNIQDFQDAILNKAKVLTLKEDMKRRKRKRAMGVAAAAVILIGAAGAAGLLYHSKRTEALLADANVSLWIPVKEGRSEEEERTIFETMVSEFRKDYPQITFEAAYIPESEYEKDIKEAMDDGQLPVLFESSSVGDDLEGHGEPMDDILSRLEITDYYFLDGYEEYFPEKEQLPLGFDVCVLYGNSTMMDNTSSFAEKNDEESFLAGKTAVCAGTASMYHQVQDMLPGRYTVKPVSEGKATGCFSGLWSVDKSATKAQKRAAQRFLYYYLSEKGQEILHVDNRGDLPLDKGQMEVYLDVNRELDFLKDELKNIKIVPSEEMEKESENIYEKLYEDREDTAAYLKETAKE